MTEELIEQPAVQEPEKSFSDNLRETFFDEKPAVQNAEPPKTEDKIDNPPAVSDQEIMEPKDWLKRHFDTEDVAVLKAEREELKQLKEKSKEFQFDEKQLKTLEYLKPEKEDELFNYLQTKKKVDRLISEDVSEKNAADIVKFQMQQKYTTLSPEDIEYKFNRQYGIPKEPKEPQEEKFISTDDYEAAKEKYLEDKQDWEQRVREVKNELLIDAKLAVPDIQKLKSELTLPDIQKPNQQQQLSQEDLAAIKASADLFVKNAEDFSKEFAGFNVPVKDKDVDYSVNYSISPEERQTVMGKLKTFAESGFDANALLADRWVSEDGKSIKTEQMVKDLSRLFAGEKIDQKIALDSANKRIESYLKDKKQINLRETDVQHPSNVGEKTMSEKLAEQFFN